MPKRGRGTGASAADEAMARRQVVAARVVMPNGELSSAVSPTGPERQAGQGFGWSSLLSGLPGEPDDDHLRVPGRPGDGFGGGDPFI